MAPDWIFLIGIKHALPLKISFPPVHGKQPKTKKKFLCHRGLTASCFNFCFFCCFFFLLFTVLHLNCTQLHFSLTDAFFIFFRIRKSRTQKGIPVIPFVRRDDIKTLPSRPSLISKVVSACSAICKHPRTRPEVQRLSSLLLPKIQHNKKEIKTERERTVRRNSTRVRPSQVQHRTTMSLPPPKAKHKKPK